MSPRFLFIQFAASASIAGALIAVAGCRSTPQTFRDDAVSTDDSVVPASAEQETGGAVVSPPTARANDGSAVAQGLTSEDSFESSRSSSPLTKLFDRFSRPRRIPLPRTEESAEDGSLAASGSPTPGLEDF